MLLLLGIVAALASSTIARAAVPTPDFSKIFPAGPIAVVQVPSGDTRLFFQSSNASIELISINGPFLTGTIYDREMLVPAGEAVLGTPIAVVASTTTTFNGIRLYFVSPSNILSEYIFDINTGWSGGPSCVDCMTVENFVVNPGNHVLYAMWNTAPTAENPITIRVGFTGAGAPEGLTEAEWDDVHGWRLAELD
ncbi:hypothetical protein MSAN_01747800 [Mycena sanguinolenta]|uniref:Fucose-specific lectin n=1 Tax=Mycena sanguinolenta TaxID=230812 RepID=A0A8H6XVJ6_9AGAR|nr:hypothetical protein MSAN_01747800 [Mycena sanguinolenta]